MHSWNLQPKNNPVATPKICGDQSVLEEGREPRIPQDNAATATAGAAEEDKPLGYWQELEPYAGLRTRESL